MQGLTLDCGNKLGYLTANIKFGMVNPEIGDALRVWLKAQEF